MFNFNPNSSSINSSSSNANNDVSIQLLDSDSGFIPSEYMKKSTDTITGRIFLNMVNQI